MAFANASDPIWPLPDPALAARIDEFQIGPQDVAMTYNHRLARECNWPDLYAERVATEYRRFLYLMAISTQELTPSEAVDTAWHLHLSYTRSYWDDLCGTVLKGRALHHNPTQGGKDEEARFRLAYNYTLDLYGHIFGRAPPEDIWPPATIRFARAADMRTVSTGDYYLVPRLPPFAERTFAFIAGMGSALWAIFRPIGQTFPDFPVATGLDVIGGILGMMVFFTYAFTGRWPKTTVSAGGGCGGCGGCGG